VNFIIIAGTESRQESEWKGTVTASFSLPRSSFTLFQGLWNLFFDVEMTTHRLLT